MDFNISRFRHAKEKFYGSIMLVIGTLIWAVVLLIPVVYLLQGKAIPALIFALYFAAFWLFSFIARALTRAYMLGHFVMVGPAQFPQLHRMVVEGTQTVGLKEVPATFVYNSSGVMNAMALRLVGRSRYIWLTSALIDCDDEDQVRFVVGHELGHHVAGHLDEPWSYLRLPAHFIPFLAPAYSRARELTCDRVGVFVARNLQASRTALQMLACGSAKLNRQMNPDAFQAQERMVPGIAGFVLNAISGYPRLTRRVEAVTQFYAGANTRAEPAPARAQAVQPA
ncbi:peptidase [Bosea caraganae]|uniref:Peptidase n=2 Tax=Bosea caraganae TaxID=2763117 RepID=A0A370KZN7_9HYPH|nr:peptidase [Bosea caraganae]RDJ29966.1 peptidase [Bosea caraganae]